MDQSPFQPNSPYYEKLRALLRAAGSREELLEAIVNAPFHELRQTTHLDLGIIALLVVNKKGGTIDTLALSDTELARGAAEMAEKPFGDIRIPLGDSKNIVARAIATGQPQAAADWKFLAAPALPVQAARLNQAGGGIEYSQVYPLLAGDGGALIFSFFQPGSNIGPDHIAFMEAYTRIVDDALVAAQHSPTEL